LPPTISRWSPFNVVVVVAVVVDIVDIGGSRLSRFPAVAEHARLAGAKSTLVV